MCFVCGIDNPIGLHLAFYTDDQGRCIARFRPRPEQQGYPGHLHGGIISCVLVPMEHEERRAHHNPVELGECANFPQGLNIYFKPTFAQRCRDRLSHFLLSPNVLRPPQEPEMKVVSFQRVIHANAFNYDCWRDIFLSGRPNW
jgi:hypothetical protein